MTKWAVTRFFKPGLLVLLLFGIFMAVAVMAEFQRWGSSAREAGMPKPPFYDEFRPYLFISIIYMFTVLPLFFLAAASIPAFPGLAELATPLQSFTPVWIITHVIYFYLLSCLVAFALRKVKSNESFRQMQNIES